MCRKLFPGGLAPGAHCLRLRGRLCHGLPHAEPQTPNVRHCHSPGSGGDTGQPETAPQDQSPPTLRLPRGGPTSLAFIPLCPAPLSARSAGTWEAVLGGGSRGRGATRDPQPCAQRGHSAGEERTAGPGCLLRRHSRRTPPAREALSPPVRGEEGARVRHSGSAPGWPAGRAGPPGDVDPSGS